MPKRIHCWPPRWPAFWNSAAQGARVVEAVFFRADGAVRRIAVETGAPVRDARDHCAAVSRAAGCAGRSARSRFRVRSHPLEARCAERADAEAIGFDADANAEKEIAVLIDRLAARFGTQRIVRFHPQDTHIPEAAASPFRRSSTSHRKSQWRAARCAGERRAGLCVFSRAPEAIEAIAEVPDGPPLRFRWRRVLHAVARAEGPERIAMEWWRHQEPQPTRDYFRVEDERGPPLLALPRWACIERETEAPALVHAWAVRMTAQLYAELARHHEFFVPARRLASAAKWWSGRSLGYARNRHRRPQHARGRRARL